MSRVGIFFNVNGKDVHLENVDPELTLAYYLRNTLGLRGTKLGCEEGVCGACTVVLGTWSDVENKAEYRAVNACLVPVFHVHRTFVITVEGVGSREKIHPIQDRMARGHAMQCGFCSPGFVMSAYALLRNHPNPTMKQINAAIRSNLCRCTGYRPILEALYSFSKDGCCGGKGKNGGCCKDEIDEAYNDKLMTFDDFPKYDATQEIIFPPSLRTFKDSEKVLVLKGNRIEVTIPKDLDQFKSYHATRTVVSSGLLTRLVASKKPENFAEKWISTKFVKEFNEISISCETVTIGAAMTIQSLADTLSEYLPTEIGSAVNQFLQQFSSQQVANFATWSGALIQGMTQSNFVSDILLLLYVLEAKLTVITEDGVLGKIPVDAYVTGCIINAEFSRIDNRKLLLLKLGETSEEDPTLFNFAALVGNRSTRIFWGCGGPPKRIPGLEKHIDSGKCNTVEEYYNVSGIQNSYNFTVAFKKLVEFLDNDWEIPEIENSDGMNYLQFFKPSTKFSVGRPIAHYFNDRAITGEAIYVNDIQTYNPVHLGFVLSTIPHGEILNVDPSEALEIEGVQGYFSVSDIPGTNNPGLNEQSMELWDSAPVFADGTVESVGQVIGVIAADDVLTARRAAKLVKVDYRKLESLVDLQDAIKANSLLSEVQHYGAEEDLVNSELEKCTTVLEGQVDMGGQEHFYMETQSSLAVPGEGDEIVVHCSSQGTFFVQLMVAGVLGLPSNKVIVKTKRLGGGFGGKCNQAAWNACMAALVAKKLKRPTYAHLSRSDDLIMTGKRHGFHAKYKVGIDSDGKVKAAHHRYWVNGGWSVDHTEYVTMVMGCHADDVYKMNAVCVEGHPVKTHSVSNTAMRGYGNPQVKIINEGIMRRIANHLGKSMEATKRLNFALEGDLRFCGERIHNDNHLEVWETCMNWCDFDSRMGEVEKFNSTSDTIKRGLAMSSVRFGLPHVGSSSHSVASLIINLDGSIQLTIGGTEMGQGLNQKMMQVCSEALKRPVETITIVDTSTDKVANAPDTGGSQDTDINGMAVLACCKRLMSRLQPIVEKNEGDWKAAIREAYQTFVPLQCTEYGVVERAKFGIKDDEYPYTTSGACAVEVEVDTLTGYNRLIRVDMVMDVGESLNPAMDIGQIEGAFMQGYGLVTCEKITINKETGCLDQDSAMKYKIPRARNVPKDFRVKLLGIHGPNAAQVYSSKGIGEPPLMMSCGAVHSAIMNCIDDWRRQNGMPQFLNTISPLSADKIRDLCSK